MTHAYLTVPEHAAAFAYLVANPSGSRSRWAAGLGWSPSKVQRFIEALRRFRLADIEVIAGCNLSVFRPLVDTPVSNRTDSGQVSIRSRSDSGQPHLEAVALDVLDTGSRCERPIETAEGLTCIAIANEVLWSNFKDHGFKPISPDNRGSHRAVQGWIAVGIPLTDMTRLIREKAAAFHPKYLAREKYPFPKSLGYFTGWIVKTWQIERRQIPLPLMTKSVNPPRPRMDKPVALGDLLPKVERG